MTGNSTARGAEAVGGRRLIGEREHFWQARYYDFSVRTKRKRVEKLRYMHRNPVKRAGGKA